MSFQTLADFETLEVISSKGKNNSVQLFKARADKKVVCVKSFTSRKLALVQEALNEAKLLLKAAGHHPNICQMFNCFIEQVDSKFRFSIVMEHFEDGDLENEIKKRKQTNLAWDDVQLLEIFGGLINALAALQEQAICHRDLKPQNIFHGGGTSFKIGDFGVSKQELFGDSTATLAGTPIYFSPLCANAYRAANLLGEVHGVQHNMYKSDVFSLGLTFLRMAGLASIRGLNSKGQGLIDARISELAYSAEVKWLLDRMLRVKECERPDFLALDRVYKEIQRPVLCQPVYMNYPEFEEEALPQPEDHAEVCTEVCTEALNEIFQAIADEYTVRLPAVLQEVQYTYSNLIKEARMETYSEQETLDSLIIEEDLEIVMLEVDSEHPNRKQEISTPYPKAE